jgi:phosphate transport system substrate-binding protein
MFRYRTAPALALTALLTVTVIVDSAMHLSRGAAANAQSTPAFSMPESVPQGTQVRIGSGADSMTALSTVLKQSFEAQFVGSTVTLEAMEADAALASLLKGQTDLAALSRPLTATEKAQGFVEVPVHRIKIALIVSAANSFQGSLRGDQFADIFRGQITDWSKVGGKAGPIRFIDHPDTSDLKLSLAAYPVFQSAPFQTGSTATQLTEHDSTALVQALGSDGIGYALVTEVQGMSGIRLLPMHDTLPTDPRYPFSQPFSFVYAGVPSPAVVAFLGYVTSDTGQAAIATVNLADLPDPLTMPAGGVQATGNTPASAGGNAVAPTGETASQSEPSAREGADLDVSLAEGDRDMGNQTDQNGMLTAANGWRQRWWLLLPVVALSLIIWGAKRDRQSGEALVKTGAVEVGEPGPVMVAGADDRFPGVEADPVDSASLGIPRGSQDAIAGGAVVAGRGTETTQGAMPDDAQPLEGLLIEGVKGRLYGMPEDANGTVQVGVDSATVWSVKDGSDGEISC